MKGDEERAEALAAFLDGHPLREDLEPLEPAVRRLTELIGRLTPDSDRIRQLWAVLSAEPPRAPVSFVGLTLFVKDVNAALSFYRDLLGLRVEQTGRGFARLQAGDVSVALQRGDAEEPGLDSPRACIELRAADLDAAVAALRSGGFAVRIALGPARRRFAELRDPDGHRIILRS